MSDNEQNSSEQQAPQSSPLGDAVKSTIPSEKLFAYNDLHTPENTPMKNLLPSQTEVKKELPEEARSRGFATVFLGNTQESTRQANELIGAWSTWAGVMDLAKTEHIAESIVTAANNTWQGFVEANYPNRSPGEVAALAKDVYTYFNELNDQFLGRSRVVHEEDVSNVSQRADKLSTGDIVGKVPGAAKPKGITLDELMARATFGSSKTPTDYHLLLRNSFTSLTFKRPDQFEIGDLINNINRRIGGYVRSVGGNTLVLSYIAGVTEVWNFLKTRIVSCSVTGLVDYGDLAKVIRYTDFQVLCSALLDSIEDEGAQMELRCIFGGCDYSKLALIDPSRLVRVRHSIQSEEDAAIFGNLFSGKKTYTIGQTLEMIEASTYGLEGPVYVYNEAQTVRLRIAPPSIADCIATFDFFVGRVDPAMKEIRQKVSDQGQMADQISMLLSSLGGSELIHWISEFATLPSGVEDESTEVYKRSESKPLEFNKGLLSVLRDKAINSNLTRAVYLKTPYMTRTFVGVRNFTCPSCGRHSSEAQGEAKLGYTPIDAYMHFFIQAQLILLNRAVDTQNSTREALL